jgi:hypothetical protein
MKPRWKELFLAFAIAVSIWYFVSGSEKVESQIEARADYRGLPQGLIVRSGTVGRVSVRVRVSVGMRHTLASRDFAFFVDLSSVKKGDNVLPINISSLDLPGGAEVIDVAPSRIFLEVDTLESRLVPLTAQVQGELPGDYTAETSVTPDEVKISGPSTEVKKIRRIVIPVTPDQPVTPGNSESRRPIPLPEGLDCSPSEARVGLHIGIKRKLAQTTRPVTVSVPPQFTLFMRPDRVRLSLAVPESLAGKINDDDGIRAYVQPEGFARGFYTLPVLVSLRDGIELVRVEPATIAVSMEEKQPAGVAPSAEKSSGTPPPVGKSSGVRPAAGKAAGTRPAGRSGK